VLLLGVTPELYQLPWPAGTDFLAVDYSPAMIRAVWPGPRGAVRCENWLDLTLSAGSRDIALCDGGLHLLAYPADQERLVRRLGVVLADQARCIFRLYVPPVEHESPDAVRDDLLRGKIPNLNILKLRLGMALQESPSRGVAVEEVWRALHEIAHDLEDLAKRIGWPVEHLQAIRAYHHSTGRYHFVTLDEVTRLFCTHPGGFEVRRVCTPAYELGRQCPTVILERRVRTPAGGR
jgi:hypothetical protein